MQSSIITLLKCIIDLLNSTNIACMHSTDLCAYLQIQRWVYPIARSLHIHSYAQLRWRSCTLVSFSNEWLVESTSSDPRKQGRSDHRMGQVAGLYCNWRRMVTWHFLICVFLSAHGLWPVFSLEASAALGRVWWLKQAAISKTSLCSPKIWFLSSDQVSDRRTFPPPSALPGLGELGRGHWKELQQQLSLKLMSKAQGPSWNCHREKTFCPDSDILVCSS